MKNINWLRIIVTTNALVTLYLAYALLQLHKVVDDLAYSLVFMAEVLEFVTRVLTQ